MQKRTNLPWQRIPQKRQITISLDSQAKRIIDITKSGGLQLVITTRPVNSHHLVPAGTRSISVFLVNARKASLDLERDLSFIFQACLTIDCQLGFVPRPNLRGQENGDYDEKVADLQYRDDYEFAVGHNVSAIAHLNDERSCQKVQTAWIPNAEVEKVIATEIPDVELGMEAIASAQNADQVKQMISGIVTAYTNWIAQQQTLIPSNSPNRAEVAIDLLKLATIANQRIAEGLAALDDPQVLDAFQIANREIATAIRQRLIHDTDNNPQDLKPPRWRPFQLAFILMNLVGIANPTHGDRECVDLLFFPTGGGKTEAYLGLAAFTLILRRLKNLGIQGAGVSVIMRYTLRLLTLDQFGRAATLICALELERQQDIEKLGTYPFEIGLWVGQSATPNVMGKRGENNEEKMHFPGLPYIMLHSLSHLLISAVSLNCGYAASSIKERIYAGDSGYGILLFTGTTGSEGTLGGLIEVGDRIEQYLTSALELGQLCSNDPVCAEHSPENEQEDRLLHGSACHGCLLIAETSCERRNEFLDRALVVNTIANLDTGFFS